MRFGKIPASMTFISAAPIVFHCNWEDIEISIAEDKEVSPCYAADFESRDAVASGKTWAERYNAGQRKPDASVVTVTEPNVPRKLTVVGLEKRMEGGRAFKVVDEQNRLFDLREDVLLETLISVGTAPGGKLNGEFVFARVGTTMRLVRVDSSLHVELVKSEERRTQKNLDAGSLEYGGVYANRKTLFIYLGRINTVEDISASTPKHWVISAAGASEHKKLLAAPRSTDPFACTRVEVRGEHLVVMLSPNDIKNLGQCCDTALRNAITSMGLQLSKSVSAVEKVAQLELDPNWIEFARTSSVAHVTRWLGDYDKADRKHHFTAAEIQEQKWKALVGWSGKLNMTTHDKPAAVSAEYEQFEADIKAMTV